MPNTRQPSIMIFTPVLRLQPDTAKAISRLVYDGPLTVVFQRDNPTGNGKADHLHQYRRGRQFFIAGGFDYLMTIEDDIVPPPDTLTKLIALNVDVAYGCYFFRSGVINVLERHPAGRNPGESLSIRGRWPASGVIDCAGSGLGCTLIKRHVVEAHPFSGDGHHFFDCDWTKEVYQAGYEMRADASVFCEHLCTEARIV